MHRLLSLVSLHFRETIEKGGHKTDENQKLRQLLSPSLRPRGANFD
jgi:hypothetical protein